MAFHQCVYCEKSFTSSENRLEHEETCDTHGPLTQERLAAKIKQSKARIKP